MKASVLVSMLSFLGIVSFTGSKMSFVLLIDRRSETPLSQWYSAVVFILTLPEVIAFVRTMWRTSFLVKNNGTKWPSKRSFLIGIVCSLFEMTSLSLFTLEVAPKIPNLIILPTLNVTLSLLYLMNELCKKRVIITSSQLEISSNISRAIAITLGVLSICLFLIISCLLWIFKISSMLVAVLLLVCMFVLAFVWCLQRRLFTNQYESSEVRNHLMLAQSLTRVVVCVCLPIVSMTFDSDITIAEAPAELINGLLSIPNTEMFYIVLVHCSSTLFCFMLSRLSAYYTTTRSGILLPSIVSTVLSTVFLITGCFYSDFIQIIIEYDCEKENIHLILFGIALLVWLIPFLIEGKNCFVPSGVYFKPEKESFTSNTYNSVFLDQHLALHYTYDISFNGGDLNDTLPTRVFICSTMYRESEYEMRQLLLSLHRVSISSLLKNSNVYLESHIFMDNGSDGVCLKEFAVQCLTLIESITEDEQIGGKVFQTPYGIQIAYILPGGMPLFVHLKDPNLVKSKKRWSQVMYFEYIIKYRIKETHLISRSSINSIWSISDSTNSSITIPAFVNISNVSNKSENILNAKDLETTQSERLKVPFIDSLKTQTNSSWDNSSNDSGIFDVMLKSSNCGTQSNSIADSTEDVGEISLHEGFGESLRDENLSYDNKTYVLCTDADMYFSERSVLDLVYTCNQDLSLGASCGRTYPISRNSNPLVWFQKFEYARDFWMIKSAQNVIGTVMCCPGCFSLYRVKALVDVLPSYSEATTKAFEVFTKNTGEDRWMCTLMMLTNWKLHYSSSGTNSTSCPESFEELIKQRRRWILSDIANNMLVFHNIFRLIRKNSCFTLLYLLYLVQQFSIMVLCPTTTILMITIGLQIISSIPFLITAPVFAVFCIFYVFACVYMSTNNQILLTKGCIVLGGALACTVITGGVYFLIRDVVFKILYHSNSMQGGDYILVGIIVSLLCAALLHPKESPTLLLGVFYSFFFPATTIILPIYAVCNIVDQSWGTRENQKAKLPKTFCFPKLKRKNKRNENVCVTERVIPSETFTDLPSHEKRFWIDLVAKVIGTDAVQDLNQSELQPALRKLRTHVLVVVFVINIISLTIMSYFLQNGALEEFALVTFALYGFSFCIQFVGMTVFKFKEFFLRLGKICFPGNSAWVTTSPT